MFNLISFLAGLVAALLMIVGLVPLLGWVNWIMLPIAGVGLVFGLLSESDSGRNFNIMVLAVGVVRLWLGGGIF